MNTKILIASTSLALLSAGAALAQNNAQPSTVEIAKPERPFRASIGIFGPTGSGFRSAAGSVMPMISLGYDVGKTQSPNPWVYGVYLDWATNKKHGTTNSLTGFGVSGRYMLENPNNTNGGYVGAGIGSYNVKVGSSNSKVGGKLFGGFERNSGYFVEASYNYVTKVNGFDPSGFGLTVGRRF